MDVSATNKQKKNIENVWEAYVIVHGTILVPSGLEWGVLAESPHLSLD